MAKICAYCGNPMSESTVDHVIPGNLYPKSIRAKNVQLLTVPACNNCNASYSDDEEHFRNVIVCAGKNTPLVNELFYSKVNASFVKHKRLRHLRQLCDLMKDYRTPSGKRHIIYPMQDTHFVRILKKILRGLAFHHFRCPVLEENIWVDVLKYVIPPALLDNVRWYNYNQDVFEYYYEICNVEGAYESYWLLKILKTRQFIGRINMSGDMDFDKMNCVNL